MIEIALAPEGEGVFQKVIASRQNISAKYLDQIIMSLKIAGLIANSKGKKSGYILSRPASEITALDIVTAFNPGELITECLSAGSECPVSGMCAAQLIWTGLNGEIRKYLSDWTLSRLKEEHMKFKENENGSMYYI